VGAKSELGANRQRLKNAGVSSADFFRSMVVTVKYLSNFHNWHRLYAFRGSCLCLGTAISETTPNGFRIGAADGHLRSIACDDEKPAFVAIEAGNMIAIQIHVAAVVPAALPARVQRNMAAAPFQLMFCR
jgi:hypothetical protein